MMKRWHVFVERMLSYVNLYVKKKKVVFFLIVSKSLFKKKEISPLEKQKEDLNKEIDQVLKGTGLLGGLMGSIVKGTFGMITGMMASSAADIDRVLQEAEKRLEFQLGPGVKCDAPFQRSYSSSNINGQVSKRVRLACQATAASGITAIAHIDASIDSSGNVDILDLWLDNNNNRGRGGPPHIQGGNKDGDSFRPRGGGGGGVTIIDV